MQNSSIKTDTNSEATIISGPSLNYDFKSKSRRKNLPPVPRFGQNNISDKSKLAGESYNNSKSEKDTMKFLEEISQPVNTYISLPYTHFFLGCKTFYI